MTWILQSDLSRRFAYYVKSFSWKDLTEELLLAQVEQIRLDLLRNIPNHVTVLVTSSRGLLPDRVLLKATLSQRVTRQVHSRHVTCEVGVSWAKVLLDDWDTWPLGVS